MQIAVVFMILAGIYLLIINLAGFIICIVDKNRAIKHEWRIKEKTFFIVVFLGGALGVYIGMKSCRHKTKHWYFAIGIPLIFICQLILVIIIVCLLKTNGIIF